MTENVDVNCLNKLSLALSKAQAEIKGATKDSVNQHFKNKYASLEDVWNACREPLSKNELSIIQTMHSLGEMFFLRTILTHSSGQSVFSDCPLILQRKDMQGLGSAITYARRYGLSAMVGVCPSDETEDDGNSASNVGQNQNKQNKKVELKKEEPKKEEPNYFNLFMNHAIKLAGPKENNLDYQAIWDYIKNETEFDKSVDKNNQEYWAGVYRIIQKITQNEVLEAINS